MTGDRILHRSTSYTAMPAVILAVSGAVLLIAGLANNPRVAWPYWIIWLGTAFGFVVLSLLPDGLIDTVVLGGCTIVSSVGIGQVLAWWAGVDVPGAIVWRPDSIVRSCNILGEIALWAGILAVARRRWVLVAVFAITLLISGARTAYLAAMASAAAWSWLRWPSARWAVILIGVVGAVGLYVVSVSMGRMELDSRTILWRAVLGDPVGVFGGGPGYIKAHLVHSTIYGDLVWHAHNLLVQAWGDTGVLGVIAALALVWLLLSDAIKSKSTWLIVYVSSVFTSSVFEYLYWVPGVALLGLIVYKQLRIANTKAI